MATTLTREELYEAVWSEPTTKVAKRMGISDVALAKACRSANVPKPPLGYWARKVAGKKVLSTPLPPRDFGMAGRITIGAGRYWGYADAADDYPLDEPPPDAPRFPEPLDAVVWRAAAALAPVKFRNATAGTHPAIGRLIEEDKQRRVRYTSSRYPSVLDKPRYDGPIEERRLRILDALFSAMSSLGHTPHVIEPGNGYERDVKRGARVRINDSTVGFTVEPIAAGARKRGRPSDRLRLELTGDGWFWSFPRSWEDREGQRLETMLREVATYLLVAAEDHYRSLELRRHQWRLGHREEQLEKRERKRREEAQRAEQARLAAKRQRERTLLRMAQDNQRAETIRAWVARVEAQATRGGERPAGLDSWAAWALQVADELDPLPGFAESLAADNSSRTTPDQAAVAGSP